ncbi:MAG: RNA methyltransferase [Pseudomonadales bacterium]|nr:RNA methyltransferase [Pseudomonadales bacterium]
MKMDDIKKLHQKKYRQQFGQFLVEGEHLIEELEKAAAGNACYDGTLLFVTEQYQHWPSRFEKKQLSEQQFARLSETRNPQGILAVVPVSAVQGLKQSSEKQRAIYLSEIQDPGNLGTILRSLAWFGGFRCLLSPGSVDPFNGKVVRASMGAIFHVPVETDVSIETLASRYTQIGCLDMQGKTLKDKAFRQCDCLVFGNEARGIEIQPFTDMKVERYTITGNTAIDSLNLATVVSLCAYEFNR